ncbi:enoyl-CoA hydratase/isomerase family protein [Glutamicibacter sp. MNS18]|uniref:enoyl-CoA hydratase/isomerase family protein n=1 Tax=Glutamicibacter sp. MNS18 TaxID=2989817 RepID=UPI0022369A3E|nr:enoyl-CoA hydratase/isomerase family protein [Glutamicibacter sp. MNS18]MCW4467081.1 enoyl-CoA hydratase/isomerase family protein [Glutamicibacter sp. MNS18]
MSELVVARTHGPIGYLELNRPQKINALNLPMLTALDGILRRWAEDRTVQLVVLGGRGERGFCAGGDIAAFHQAVTSGEHAAFHDLLALEFVIDHFLSAYPKPVLSLAHGITMGGGIGLASHAPVRVVTRDARMGMPETRIGYTPDVGGSHLLARSPGYFGEYFAMTAGSFTGADAPFLGFADVVLPAGTLPGLLDELDDLIGLDAGQMIASLELLHGSVAPSPLEAEQGWIDHAFSADSPAEVLARLDAMVHPRAAAAAAAIRANSPTSVTSAFLAVRAARAEDHLRSALDRELRLADYLMHLPDLAEGIRAQVIDKDRNPAWSPGTLDEVDIPALTALM